MKTPIVIRGFYLATGMTLTRWLSRPMSELTWVDGVLLFLIVLAFREDWPELRNYLKNSKKAD
ncbi:hypothetical protein [Pararhizobium qamdonense]|uniref:hypothetical protein n=1 Tax=Pararhizobium qamdonense TaxID=3031126 RepID=UPI0023E120C5|nr:hypothetical protein [Pararhizobium qamdonense]